MTITDSMYGFFNKPLKRFRSSKAASRVDYSQINGFVWLIIEEIDRYIKEFEYISGNELFDDSLPNIGNVYMNSIILDFAILFSIEDCDKAGLRQLKAGAPKKAKVDIEELEKTYNDIITKVKSNRRRIIAHRDISKENAYYYMGFSEIEINRIIEDYKKSPYFDKPISDEEDLTITAFKKIQASSKENERYSLSDFQNDIPRLKEIIEKSYAIVKDINNYYHKKKL